MACRDAEPANKTFDNSNNSFRSTVANKTNKPTQNLKKKPVILGKTPNNRRQSKRNSVKLGKNPMKLAIDHQLRIESKSIEIDVEIDVVVVFF